MSEGLTIRRRVHFGRGRDPIPDRHLRPIPAVLDWRKQRQVWEQLMVDQLGP